jgi:hypothetical protein
MRNRELRARRLIARLRPSVEPIAPEVRRRSRQLVLVTIICAVVCGTTAATVGEVTKGRTASRYKVFYCVADAAADAIEVAPLRESMNGSEGNELRVWVSRGREADLLLRVTKQGGEVIVQFVAFEEAMGKDIDGRFCGAVGLNVGVTVLDSHTIPLTARSPILHRLLANGAWTLGSSEPESTLGIGMSLILERRNMGSYSIDAHDNPGPVNGPDSAAACAIIRAVDAYASATGLDFMPDSCTVRSDERDPN